jgi:hypothetical protein
VIYQAVIVGNLSIKKVRNKLKNDQDPETEIKIEREKDRDRIISNNIIILEKEREIDHILIKEREGRIRKKPKEILDQGRDLLRKRKNDQILKPMWKQRKNQK